MSKDIYISDIIVHLHPKSYRDDKDQIENDLRSHNGVLSVHFTEPDHPHAVLVAYNPDAVSSQDVLAEVRKSDGLAMMAGM